MKIIEFKKFLNSHPRHHLNLILPEGGAIPAHAHITEVGRVDKTFLDCGATMRKSSFCCLQAWVADDLDHRLEAAKLAIIIERAAPLFGGDDLEVEIEYEYKEGFISQFPLLSAEIAPKALIIQLGTRHTDCLAKEICLPNPASVNDSECCSSSGCC